VGCCGFWLFCVDPLSLANSHIVHLPGSASCVFAYWGSAAPMLSLYSFYNYARGHCEAVQSFSRVVHCAQSDFESKSVLRE